MATKRPAKLAIGKKVQQTRICPETGKSMTAVRVVQSEGPSGMQWVVLEDFDGSDASAQRMIPIR